MTLCDPIDCSLPGSSVHGILQARILEWYAMPSSRRSSQPRDGILYIGRWVLWFSSTTNDSWEAPCSSYRFARLILSHFLWDLTFYASVSCPRTTNSKLTGLDEILPLLVLADWTGPLYSHWFSSWEQVICTGLPNISEHKYNLGLLPVHWISQAKGQ